MIVPWASSIDCSALSFSRVIYSGSSVGFLIGTAPCWVLFFELGDLSKLAEVAVFTLAAVNPVTPLLR